jgi:hypothetical protein
MKKITIFCIYMLSSIVALAQDNYTVSGYLKDVKNGEVLIGATVMVSELKTGTTANSYGFYSLSLPKGEYTIVISYLGYKTITRKVSLIQNINLTVELEDDAQELKEVEITAEQPDAQVKKVEMSVNKLDIKDIKKIPAFMGEVDVIRSIQLLPGVTTVGEGASGFNVRGGGVDQNLILLDEAPVFNSSHLFGFFSVFNPDAVKDVKLIKGGIPAEYGGRISSILDVRMKDGNSKKLEVNGGVGLIFSRLSIEAPINKGKGSFIVAGRRSYIDVLAKPFLKGDLKKAKFNFYDLTAKANYTLNDKNRLFLSGYLGRDVFGAGFKFNWGNATATLRWNHIFGSKLFLNTSLIYSNYDYMLAFGVGEEDESFEWKSRIITYSIKPEFSYFANTNNTVKFGVQSSYYNFVPGSAVAESRGITANISVPDKYALESAAYISNEQKIGTRLLLQYGLRFSTYQYLGKGFQYFYNDTTPGIRKSLDRMETVGQNEVIKTYSNIEPRLSAKIDVAVRSSIKASYARGTQYLHLISNTTASTPLDIWTPSTNNIKPQIADQFALGYFQNFGNNSMYEFSVEVYYKQMQNQIDYINDANLLLNEYLEADLLSGKGRAYGSEFFLKKAKGKFNGWVSYTLGRTERQVTGVNFDKWFPNRFDRLHNVNVVGSYDLTERWSLSANWVLATGTPATFPTNRIEVQGYVIPHNSEEKRNNYRIPAYHRLDLSATLQLRKKETRKWEGNWVFSIYNVYNHQNAFSVFFRQNPDDPTRTEAVRYTIIGTVVPSVAFNFKF